MGNKRGGCGCWKVFCCVMGIGDHIGSRSLCCNAVRHCGALSDYILDPDPVPCCCLSSLSGHIYRTPLLDQDPVLGCSAFLLKYILIQHAVITGLLPGGPRGGLLSGQRLHCGTAAHAGNTHTHTHTHTHTGKNIV